MVRADDGRGLERSRQIDPRALGVTKARLQQARARVSKTVFSATRGANLTNGADSVIDSAARKSIERGGYVAYFAAGSAETTPEALLPLYASNAKTYGLFSFTLRQALQSTPNATYAELLQTVQSLYATAGRKQPTPGIEGDQAHRIVLGAAVSARPPLPLQVEIRWRRRCANRAAACSIAPIVVRPNDRPVLEPGDILDVEILNSTSSPIDLWVSHATANNKWAGVYPDAARRENARLAANQRKKLQLVITDDTVGVEQLLILAVATTPSSPIVDFSKRLTSEKLTGLSKIPREYAAAQYSWTVRK
jgi:hypothetical protein